MHFLGFLSHESEPSNDEPRPSRATGYIRGQILSYTRSRMQLLLRLLEEGGAFRIERVAELIRPRAVLSFSAQVAELVRVWRLKHGRIRPREPDREDGSTLQQAEALDQPGVGGPESTTRDDRNALGRVEARGIHHQRVPFPVSDRIAAGRGIEDFLVDVRLAVEIQMAHRRHRRLRHDHNFPGALT